jgi:hypothetical protein
MLPKKGIKMGILKKLFASGPKLTKLLVARIVADEDHRYFISFSINDPKVKNCEFVRLILHYYAKLLFNFDPSNREMSHAASILKSMVQSLLNKGIRKHSNVLKDADIDDVAKIISTHPQNLPREIVATLYFVDEFRRAITTDIPRNVYAQHMVFSVAVLIQAALNEMDQDSIYLLNRSLTIMNEFYDSGVSYSDIKCLESVPHDAYLSAKKGEKR